MRFAFFGDVVGRSGREGLADHLPGLRARGADPHWFAGGKRHCGKNGSDPRDGTAHVEGAADRCHDGHGVIPCGRGLGFVAGRLLAYAGHGNLPGSPGRHEEETPWRTAQDRMPPVRGRFP